MAQHLGERCDDERCLGLVETKAPAIEVESDDLGEHGLGPAERRQVRLQLASDLFST
jgi:hypothetical protein